MEAQRGSEKEESTWEDQKPPALAQLTHLLGVQYLQKWEEQGRQEGGDGHRDDVCAPVDGHEDDNIGAPGKLKRQF